MQLYAQQKDALKLAIPSFPPFYFASNQAADSATPKGLVIDYVGLLQQNLDFPLEIVHIPYARIIPSIRSGAIDGALMFKNSELKDDVAYLGAVSKAKIIVLSRKNMPINTYDDLHALKSIAVIRGASFQTKFDTDDNLQKYLVKDYPQAIRMFSRGRADAVIGAFEGLDHFLKQGQLLPSQFAKPYYLCDQEVWFHLSVNSPFIARQQQIQAAIDALYSTYLYRELYRNQLGSGESEYMSSFQLFDNLFY